MNTVLQTLQRDTYTLEQRLGKYNRKYWVAIVDGKVVGKSASTSHASMAAIRLRCDQRRAAERAAQKTKEN